MEEDHRVLIHLLMLEAGAAAGAGWDLKFLCGVEELLLEPPIQVP